MNYTIGLAISTLNDGIFRVEELCKSNFDEIVVLHQVTELEKMKSYSTFYEKISRNNITIQTQQETGLSSSRNRCIALLKTDYILICDDDIKLVQDVVFNLHNAIAQFPYAAVITGRILNTNKSFYKHYSEVPFQHSLRSAAKVSSVEMLINRKWFLENNTRFNENFGLGTTYPSGEEFILLADVIRKNGKVFYVPINICMHPEVSSGKKFNKEMIIAKGAMMRKVYGLKYIFINLAFSIRKYSEYKNDISFLQFIRYIYSGSMHIK